MVYQKDLDLEKKWNKLLLALEDQVGKKPSGLNAVLFLIGVQELGKGRQVFSKEEKQDLMHIAICKLLSQSGYYQLIGRDQHDWPIWELVKPLPKFDLVEQEKLLKMSIVEYFSSEVGLDI